jgi:type II secretory pathway pseudopilin PulG
MNSKVQTSVKVALILISVFLTYRIYNSIMQPIKFNRIYDVRLCEVTEQLENLREAQLTYKSENGNFCSDLQTLVAFVDTGVVSIIERKDTSFMYYDKVYQKDMNKDSVIMRVLGQEPVKTQVFGEGFDASTLLRIAGTDSLFSMNAGKIVKNGVEVATFEVSAPFTTVFADVADEYPDAFYKVKNESWTIGSLTQPTISGNYENTKCKTE